MASARELGRGGGVSSVCGCLGSEVEEEGWGGQEC